MRTSVHRVAGTRARRLPERDAVMVLRRGDDVLRPGPREQLGPVLRVELRGGPGVEEVVVRRAAVDLLMVPRRRAAGNADRVVVPLGVRVVREPLVVGDRPQGTGGLGPGGNGVGAPVDEDPEPGIPEPGRDGPLQAGPQLWAVRLVCGGTGHSV